jgi:L-threonylcarbamoyladenylate synthase
VILQPTIENVAAAAQALRDGQLVVMPTETVYGLAADATNREALLRVFETKGRPAENPLIVHVTSLEQLWAVVSDFSAAAAILASRFWPGPLTLVLPKHPGVPSEVTAGLDTVAVRMPAHPVAIALIQEVGRPVAAPSANRFMGLSPTKAEHVDIEIEEKVAMILDGGPCRIGLESTVVDCTAATPRILRPGGVTRADIQAALGGPLDNPPANSQRRSPGMYARHYAPRATVELVDTVPAEAAGLTLDGNRSDRQVKMPRDAQAYSSVLYDALHQLDSLGVDKIYVQRPPAGPEWEAVNDRLKKASSSEGSIEH